MKTTKYALALALGLLYLVLPNAARADTIYTYTGNPYTPQNCSGTYVSNCTSLFLTITFDTTLTGAALANLGSTSALADISATLTSFTITDGTGLIITQANASTFSFFIATGPTGLITGWAISAQTPTSATAFNLALSCGGTPNHCQLNLPNDGSATNQVGGIGGSGPATGSGGNASSPGIWSSPTTVTAPEPSSAALLGAGLLSLMGMTLLRRRPA